MPRALITGITGQDGSYLAEHLLALGYEVFGVVRQVSGDNTQRIQHLIDRLTLLQGDLLDQGSLVRAVQQARPDEVYNLAAQSFVGRSWKEPVHTAEVTGMGALRVFEAVRLVHRTARVYQASSSEMYGYAADATPSARGPFEPHSPYGTAKLFAHHSALTYRQSFGLHMSTGILFNHESPRRGAHFVTRKITRGAARIHLGSAEPLLLGNLQARRDWGWAPDYVRAMHAMLQLDEPVDLVLGTGRSHSVADLAAAAFDRVGLDWREHVEVDPALVRPAEIEVLTGDPSPARELIGWEPSLSFEEMVGLMVDAELALLRGGPLASWGASTTSGVS